MQDHTYSVSPEKLQDIFEEVPVEYAGFWERFGASFLDGLILIIPNLLMRLLFGRYSIIFDIIIYWLYYAIQESGENQATFGKRSLGIKVTDISGQRISFAQASGRYFGKYISMIILFIGYFMMLWNEKRQTLHDMMAETLVVKA